MKNLQINSVLSSYPDAHKLKLEQLRVLVHQTANEIEEIKELEESLKWDNPVSLPNRRVWGPLFELINEMTGFRSILFAILVW